MDNATAALKVNGVFQGNSNSNGNTATTTTTTTNTTPSSPLTPYTNRAKLATEMAKRIAGGANLQTVARDQNMTVEQVCRMIAMFAGQAGEIAKAALGEETMYSVISENKEGQGKAIQDQCEQEMVKAKEKKTSNGWRNGVEEEETDKNKETKIPSWMPRYNVAYYRL